MKTPPSYEKVLSRIASLCARSEQCSSDILQKLRKSGLTEGECYKALEWLEVNRFIDDRRFAGCFARDKVRFAGWGRRKILAALALKHIPRDMAAEAMESVPEEDCRDALMRAANSKAKGLDLAARSDRNKLIRHLASRGFDVSMIMDAVRRLGGAADDDCYE